MATTMKKKRAGMERYDSRGVTATVKLRRLSTSRNISHGVTIPVEIMEAVGWEHQDTLRLTVIDENGKRHIAVTRMAG
jgi:hypothetical protein